MSDLVSLIIPSYNRAQLLGETLQFILAQDYLNWECLVVDDGSEDYTSELMEFYCAMDPRIQFLHRPDNKPKGANACRNYGFEKSRGKYINFFDSDDLIHPEKLKIQVEQLSNSDNHLAVCKVNFFKENKENIVEDWRGRIASNDPLNDYIKGNISWLTPAVLWKRTFLTGLKTLFDEQLQASQEWEFHCRILAHSPSYCIKETPLVWMRKHNENISYNKDFEKREWYYFLARLKLYRYGIHTPSLKRTGVLREYLHNSFKSMVRANNPYACKALKCYMLQDRKYSVGSKIYGLISLISFKIFGRGDVFLNQIKL